MKRILEWLLGPAADDVTPEEAYQKHFEDSQPTLIVDVRQPAEYEWGTIPGVERVPLTRLGKGIGELPRDRTILTICHSGHRSPIAARRLRKAGMDVLNVEGGMVAWQEAGLPVER